MNIQNYNKRGFYNDVIKSFINMNQSIINSTIFKGTLYEHTVIRELNDKLCVQDMEKVGGAGDGGVDLTGKWPIKIIYDKMDQVLHLRDANTQTKMILLEKIKNVKSLPLVSRLMLEEVDTSLNILAQCKAFTKSKVTPKELRELIGTYTYLVPKNKRNNTIMLMCSPQLLTKDGLKLVNGLKLPFLYLRIEEIRRLDSGKFDVDNSGNLSNYYENEYAKKLFQGCGIIEWLKLGMYKHYEQNSNLRRE